MSDLLLIHSGGQRSVYQNLSTKYTAIEPPLWCRLIGGYIEDQGFSVNIWDADALESSPEDVAKSIENVHPQLVCIVAFGHQPSASTQSMTAVSKICKEIKARSPKQQVAVVGGHVSALPQRTWKEEEFDYVIVGEGPLAIWGILKGQIEKGICGVGDPLISDLEEFHGNMWRQLPMDKYRAHNWQCFGDLSSRQPYASIYTSLGCPYKCSFCCINTPFGGNFYRMRKPLGVVAEISALYIAYGVKTFKIIDEMFVLNRGHVEAICNGLRGLPYVEELNIWAYARVDTITSGMLEHLKGSGIKWLALGIESGSAHVRDGANKSFNSEDIKEVVRAIQDAGINVLGNFIFGLPDDNYTSMNETLDLAKELNCEFVNFYSAMAYPGSPLYTQAIADGLELPKDWSGYSQHSYDCTPLPTYWLSSSDVLRFRDEAFQSYYLNPRYLDMLGEKFGEETRTHVVELASQKLERHLLGEAT